MPVCVLSTPGILKLFLTAAEKKFLCLEIRNCIILWYCDLLTRWENLHRENWKMNRISWSTIRSFQPCIRGYFMAKNSFIVEVTFNDWSVLAKCLAWKVKFWSLQQIWENVKDKWEEQVDFMVGWLMVFS